MDDYNTHRLYREIDPQAVEACIETMAGVQPHEPNATDLRLGNRATRRAIAKQGHRAKKAVERANKEFWGNTPGHIIRHVKEISHQRDLMGDHVLKLGHLMRALEETNQQEHANYAALANRTSLLAETALGLVHENADLKEKLEQLALENTGLKEKLEEAAWLYDSLATASGPAVSLDDDMIELIGSDSRRLT